MDTLSTGILAALTYFLDINSEGVALSGAHAANCYRAEPRAVTEVSIALALGSTKKSKKIATEWFTENGYQTSYLWLTGLQSKTGKAEAVIIGEKENEDSLFLEIPSLPWVTKGVRRGQALAVSFGGKNYSVVPAEDLVIAKLHAIDTNISNAHDIDDLQSIFTNHLNSEKSFQLDLPYIIGELTMLQVSLPETLSQSAPEELKKLTAQT